MELLLSGLFMALADSTAPLGQLVGCSRAELSFTFVFLVEFFVVVLYFTSFRRSREVSGDGSWIAGVSP